VGRSGFAVKGNPDLMHILRVSDSLCYEDLSLTAVDGLITSLDYISAPLLLHRSQM